VPTTPGEEREDDGGGGTGPDDPHAATPRIIPVTAMANSAGRTRDDFGGCKRMLDPPQGDNIIACAASGAQEPPRTGPCRVHDTSEPGCMTLPGRPDLPDIVDVDSRYLWYPSLAG
jgi:hypothetical protein